MFVVTDKRLADFVVLQQFARLPGIFARDQGNLIAKYAQGAKRDVFEIPNGRRDCVQRGLQTLAVYLRDVRLLLSMVGTDQFYV